MLSNYWSLCKPGIVFGNLISIIGGFLLASKGAVDWQLFFFTSMGISLVIASGCVFNNCLDRDIDQLMCRTQNRVLVIGSVKVSHAIFFGFSLMALGFSSLWLQTTPTTFILVLLGFLVYVGFYTLYFKRNSIHGTLVGSVSGSIPPVAGYCAVTNDFDIGALVLFLIFSIWQLPHSYAIAIYRWSDYKAAQIPVLPLMKGIAITRHWMILQILVLTFFASSLGVLGYSGWIYTSVVLMMGICWLALAMRKITKENQALWARRNFLFSIIFVSIASIFMGLDSGGARENNGLHPFNQMGENFHWGFR